MAELDFFLNLITSEYRNQPKFRAWAGVLLQGLVDAQNTAARLPTLFDLETAVGDQLDKVGQWIGATRFIPELVPYFFSWNVPGLGWGEGTWQGAFSPPGFQTIILPDWHYRLLLKARVAANNWDGTVEGAYDSWRKLFAAEDFQVLIQNVSPKPTTFQNWFNWNKAGLGWNQGGWYKPGEKGPGPYASDNMHVVLALIGPPVDALTKALFNGGHLDMIPAGVQVDAYVTQGVPGRPLFAWDVGPTEASDVTSPPVNLAGWGMGAWGDFSVQPAPEVTPYTFVSNATASIEVRKIQRSDTNSDIETSQGIGAITLPFLTFTAGVGSAVVSPVSVTMSPLWPLFNGTITISGANTGGFVLGSSAGAPALLQRVSGTPAGVYSDITITATQAGMRSVSVSPVLTGV